MLQEGIAVELIVKFTDLGKNEIENLRKQL